MGRQLPFKSMSWRKGSKAKEGANLTIERQL